MTLSDYFVVFLINFLMVFLLGVQSKNVNNGRHIAASITTVLILTSQINFVHYAKDMTYAVFVVSALGCIIGINCSIWFYDYVLKNRKG